MSPVYLNQPPLSSSPIPNFMELKGDHYKINSRNDQVFFGQTQDDHVSSQTLGKNPSFYSDQRSWAIEFSTNAQDLKVDNALSDGKSNNLAKNNGNNGGFHHGYDPKSEHKELGEKVGIGIVNHNNDSENSKKWKPSKVRIMQKMMVASKYIQKGEEDQAQLNKLRQNLKQGQWNQYNNNSSSNNNYNKNNNTSGVIRVCSDCHTTTTPLWRSGPQGPKSLCNACGIRQRKARRAAMAAAAEVGLAADNGSAAPIAPKDKIHHEDMTQRQVSNNESHPLPIKKRGKSIDVDKRGFSSSNNQDYVASYYYSKRRALPRDEEEGAILLMALSGGLACSS